MEQNVGIKKWYQKKRYIIPLGLFCLLVIIGLAGASKNSTVQNLQNRNQQQVKDVVTIPAHLQQLEVKQAQSTSTSKQEIAKPAQTQQAPSHYINSQGNTIQSPTKSEDDSVPAGASARCRDNTYSFSQSRRGTCSHHGGVDIWY